MTTTNTVYERLARRTDGDVYIAVVGPVRVGKSTFVQKMLEHVIIPNIESEEERRRALDEMPQSSPGLTIMTSEPKFIPANAAKVKLSGHDASFHVRLADCVGYVIDGVKGHEDENGPKLVQTPWQSELMPFQEAAKIGTDKVIRDHAHIGVLMTTDGTVNQIPRHQVVSCEEMIVQQLKEIGKPFVIVLNSSLPNHSETIALRNELLEKYDVPVIAVSVEQLSKNDIAFILEEALFEFPVATLHFEKPDWVDVLPVDHSIHRELQFLEQSFTSTTEKLRQIEQAVRNVESDGVFEKCELLSVDAGAGEAVIRIYVSQDAYKAACNEWLDQPIDSKKEWLQFLMEAAIAKRQQAQFTDAIERAKQNGYGMTVPALEDFEATEPELIQQSHFYGVKMVAKAASYHIIRVDMSAEFAPLLGSKFQSEQLLRDLQHSFEHNIDELWQTQFFGTTLIDVM
ncbi:MAG: stage IV sporulation protein A, partial [Lysinibacillus sp.]